MVDHTFVYTGAVRTIHQLISEGQLGQIYYYDSVRVNLGLFQSDVNVIWDLAVHDLSIIDRVMPYRPVAVAAHAVSHVDGHPHNVGYVTLYFPERQIAHLHVNWLAPVKVRTTLIGGSDRMILYDDVEPSEKVKVYDKGAVSETSDRYKLLVKYRYGDMWAPQLDNAEALQVEVAHFIDCVRNGTQPITDGWAGLRVVKILEAADRSIREEGRVQKLEWPDQR
jgi:predicted dehydrogenase